MRHPSNTLADPYTSKDGVDETNLEDQTLETSSGPNTLLDYPAHHWPYHL